MHDNIPLRISNIIAVQSPETKRLATLDVESETLKLTTAQH